MEVPSGDLNLESFFSQPVFFVSLLRFQDRLFSMITKKLELEASMNKFNDH
jgi:hypothetical protein